MGHDEHTRISGRRARSRRKDNCCVVNALLEESSLGGSHVIIALPLRG
jgi:hypothetical protein